MIRVTVWNEYRHEKRKEIVAKHYPNGIHNCIADFLAADDLEITTATIDEPEFGLPDELLENTDVLIWWAHTTHREIPDELVTKIFNRIQAGMGFIPLHSAHASKIFHKICGTDTNTLKWCADGEKEILWVVDPSHPIVQGLDEKIVLEQEEMYGEHFSIPTPDELVFVSWFEGGEIFRSGFCYKRGKGKVFYFRPGHETFPIYHNPQIQKVISNAVRWAAPIDFAKTIKGKRPILESATKNNIRPNE